LTVARISRKKAAMHSFCKMVSFLSTKIDTNDKCCMALTIPKIGKKIHKKLWYSTESGHYITYITRRYMKGRPNNTRDSTPLLEVGCTDDILIGKTDTKVYTWIRFSRPIDHRIKQKNDIFRTTHQ